MEYFLAKNFTSFPAFYYLKVSLYFITVKPHCLDYQEKTIYQRFNHREVRKVYLRTPDLYAGFALSGLMRQGRIHC